MTVQELMTPFPATCGPADNLAQAAEHMWDADCGIVPVVDERGHVLGVITDRDICIAAATRGRAPADIAAGDMVHGHTVVVRETELVTSALALMRRHRVRRLPVVTEDGILHGMLSLDDVAYAVGESGGVTADEIIATLKALYARPARGSSYGAPPTTTPSRPPRKSRPSRGRP